MSSSSYASCCLLLGSGGFRTLERLQLLRSEVQKFLRGTDRVLFVPYALADYEAYLREMTEKVAVLSEQEFQGIHRFSNPVQAIEEAQAVYVGGGNTFRLLKTLYELKLLEPLKRRIKTGMPYVGVSAGTHIVTPSIKTTNDMPIVYPPSFDALGVVPFQINPHYFSGPTYFKNEQGYQEHCGETRDLRISEFHEENATPVIGLWEATFLRIENGRIVLIDPANRPAPIFQKSDRHLEMAVGVEKSMRWLEGLS